MCERPYSTSYLEIAGEDDTARLLFARVGLSVPPAMPPTGLPGLVWLSPLAAMIPWPRYIDLRVGFFDPSEWCILDLYNRRTSRIRDG